jgi:hypothetical protein
MNNNTYVFKPTANISLFSLVEVINKLDLGFTKSMLDSLSEETKVYFTKRECISTKQYVFKPTADITLYALAEVLGCLQIGLPEYGFSNLSEETRQFFERK